MKFTKDEYILRNFSKIQHKKWELYIITRIIHFLNDPEIEFVCQQFIKTKRGKRYLADLCFPSLKLYYEIDEAHHKSYQNKTKDEDRQKEIIDATDFEEHRIKVFDKNIREIDSKVDEFVDIIKKRKKQFVSKGNFTAWNYEKKFSLYDKKIESNFSYTLLDLNNKSFIIIYFLLKPDFFIKTHGRFQKFA